MALGRADVPYLPCFADPLSHLFVTQRLVMIIAIKVVGVLLVLLGMANLVSLFIIDLSTLVSPAAVITRYVLMVVAGTGFFFTRKWAIFVYLGSLAINWLAFFTIYEGRSLGPVWLSFPIPIAVTLLTYFSWSQLKPNHDVS